MSPHEIIRSAGEVTDREFAGAGIRTAARGANHVIERMLAFDAHGDYVLTAYLRGAPGTRMRQHAEVQLQALLKPLYQRSTAVTARQLAEEEKLVSEGLQQVEPGTRGVAIFACSPAGLLLIQELPVPVGPAAYWDSRAHLRPLLSVVDEYERTVLVLVDKETARFFRIFLDQIDEIADLWDNLPGRHEQGGEAQSNLARRHDEHVRWHIRRVSNTLSQIVEQENVDRILLGGTPEALAELERLLPRRLRSRLAGTVQVSVFAPRSSILAQARHALQSAERAYEARRVDEVLEAVGRNQAALGLLPVAAAVAAGQVLLLIADAQRHLMGYTCAVCELAFPDLNSGLCPACGGRVIERPDFIEYLAERVIQQGGRFEEVKGVAAELLTVADGIAALLRYPVPHLSSA